MTAVDAHDHPIDADRVRRAKARGLSGEDAGRLSGLLSLLADPVRARILYALDEVEELCVGDLALALDATEDSVGYGLRLLRTAGLVATRKVGRVVFYRLGPQFPEPLREHCLRQLVAMTRAEPEPEPEPELEPELESEPELVSEPGWTPSHSHSHSHSPSHRRGHSRGDE